MLWHWLQIPHLANPTSVLPIEHCQRVPLMEVHQRCFVPIRDGNFVLCNENLEAVQTSLEPSNTQPAPRLPSEKDIGVLKVQVTQSWDPLGSLHLWQPWLVFISTKIDQIVVDLHLDESHSKGDNRHMLKTVVDDVDARHRHRSSVARLHC